MKDCALINVPKDFWKHTVIPRECVDRVFGNHGSIFGSYVEWTDRLMKSWERPVSVCLYSSNSTASYIRAGSDGLQTISIPSGVLDRLFVFAVMQSISPDFLMDHVVSFADQSISGLRAPGRLAQIFDHTSRISKPEICELIDDLGYSKLDSEGIKRVELVFTLSLCFIIAHELGHAAEFHSRFYRYYSAQLADSTVVSSGFGLHEMLQGLEVRADTNAGQIIGLFMNTLFQQVSENWKRELCIEIGIALVCAFFVFSPIRRNIEECSRERYPHVVVRWMLVTSEIKGQIRPWNAEFDRMLDSGRTLANSNISTVLIGELDRDPSYGALEPFLAQLLPLRVPEGAHDLSLLREYSTISRERAVRAGIRLKSAESSLGRLFMRGREKTDEIWAKLIEETQPG